MGIKCHAMDILNQTEHRYYKVDLFNMFNMFYPSSDDDLFM